MARKNGDNVRKPANGGSSDGGSGQVNGNAPGTGPDANGGSGSGDGSGDSSGSVIRPALDGNGDGNDGGDSGSSGKRSDAGQRRGPYKPRAEKAKVDVGSLADVIAFAHVGLAAILKNEAWALDEGEAKKLADASAKVLKHYDTPALSAIAMDWVGLVMVAGNIYAPRIAVAMASRRTAPTPASSSSSRKPANEQPAAQGDGYVDIRDPLGNGGTMRVQVAN